MRVEVTFPELEPGINTEDQVCLIPISVGQKYHDPQPFEDSLSLLAEKNYAKYVIVVADLLQHFTEMMRDSGLPKEAAERLARQKGSQWIEQSMPIIERVLEGKSFEVKRWADCLGDVLFTSTMVETHRKYEFDEAFRRSIDELVEKFLSGFDNKGKKLKGGVSHKITQENVEHLRKEELCRSYVLEETALIMVWQNRDCDLAWTPNSQCFFLAYAFGGHSTNEAIYDHLTELCQGSSYQLINIKVSVEPKKQKREKNELDAKIEMTAGAMLAMLKVSGLTPELQLATIALMSKKINIKLEGLAADSSSKTASPSRRNQASSKENEGLPSSLAAYISPISNKMEGFRETPDTSRSSTASSANTSTMYLGRTSPSLIQEAVYSHGSTFEFPTFHK